MTILITGGAGFIGSHLAATLQQMQMPFVLMDNFDSYYDPSIKHARLKQLGQVPFVEADICDSDALARIFAQYGVRRVVNLAAMPGVRYSVGRTRQYLQVNTEGAVSLMEAAVQHGCEMFVQASTSSIYGQAAQVPFKEEDAADRPLAPYPASKRASELFAHSFYNLHGLNVTVLRFFNVYGTYGRPDMMPVKALRSIIEGTPIHMWNNGEIQRDWTYVDDTVSGILAALARPMGYAVFNLGYGKPVAFADFVTLYEQLVGKTAVRVNEPAPPTEPLITYCDNTRAREQLGFAPKIELAEGLERVWEWYKHTR